MADPVFKKKKSKIIIDKEFIFFCYVINVQFVFMK